MLQTIVTDLMKTDPDVTDKYIRLVVQAMYDLKRVGIQYINIDCSLMGCYSKVMLRL